MTHLKLPLRLKRWNTAPEFTLYDANGKQIAEIIEGNGAGKIVGNMILTAVNSHAALVEACKVLDFRLRWLHAQCDAHLARDTSPVVADDLGVSAAALAAAGIAR